MLSAKATGTISRATGAFCGREVMSFAQSGEQMDLLDLGYDQEVSAVTINAFCLFFYSNSNI